MKRILLYTASMAIMLFALARLAIWFAIPAIILFDKAEKMKPNAGASGFAPKVD